MNKYVIEFIVGLLITAALVGGFIWCQNVAYHKGYDAAVVDLKASSDKTLATETVKAHEGETKLQDKIYKDALSRTQERTDYEKTIAASRKSALAGTSGMRCPGSAVRSDTARTDSAAASGSGAEGGYDLVPQASSDIQDTASDIRRQVLKINALVDAYNDARATCNSSKSEK